MDLRITAGLNSLNTLKEQLAELSNTVSCLEISLNANPVGSSAPVSGSTEAVHTDAGASQDATIDATTSTESHAKDALMGSSTAPATAVKRSDWHLTKITPIFRIFDVAKANQFYVDYLGFRIDWQHKFEPGLPLYMQVSRGGLIIHLTEHYGDTTPGTSIYFEIKGLRAYHAELLGQLHGYSRPGIKTERDELQLTLHDPFGNKLHFTEKIDA
jgi:catechol 2,3-dioxygenase-like lactoylglutathione lyase family enzyme